MSKRKGPEGEITFDIACDYLQENLRNETRKEIVNDLLKSKTIHEAMERLRDGMRSHSFKAGADQFHLQRIVSKFDSKTRQDGFHVLNDWDGKADKLNKDIIPIDLLNYFISARQGQTGRKSVEILLDYYLMYVLSLFCMRAWAEGDANHNLDRLTQILEDLQGAAGSGHRFADNAETLILIATSHFEPDDQAYVRLLAKIRGLNESHQLNMSLIHSGILGSHLRFGFEFQYRRDIAAMRSDNAPDYPWLCFSLLTLMRFYGRMHDTAVQGPVRDKIVEGILTAISPDARAFAGKPPAPLAEVAAEHAQFDSLFTKYRQDLFKEFENHRPSEQTYSPLSLDFNFPHNVVKGMVAHSVLSATPSSLTLNDLLTGIPRDEELTKARETWVRTLMGYARSSPDTIRGKLVPIIIYDVYKGVRNYAKTLSLLD